MSNDDAARWQDHLPLDDVPEPSAHADDVPGADPWDVDFADPFADAATTNLFSEEIENVNATDWDVDADSIWGDDAGNDAGVTGLDFPL